MGQSALMVELIVIMNFGSEKEDGDQSISYYLWAFCQEYYIDQEGEMKKGMQLSGPVVITGQIVDGKVVLLSHQSFEGDSEAAMDAFPRSIIIV